MYSSSFVHSSCFLFNGGFLVPHQLILSYLTLVCEYYIRQDAKHDEAQKLFWDTIVDIYAVHGKYHTWTDPDYQSTIIW